VRASEGGGGAGTIVVDIPGTRAASTKVGEAAQAFAELGRRIASQPLPDMPVETAAIVEAALADAAAVLGRIPGELVADAQELRVRALWAEIADRLMAGYPLSGSDLNEFKSAYAAGLLDRYAEPWQRDLADAYAKKLHDEEHPGGLTGFLHAAEHDVGDFFSGAWDAIKDPAAMIYHLTPLSGGDFLHNWENLGEGLAQGVEHPLRFAKAIANVDALEQRGFSYWLGNLAPAVAATLLSGGAAAAVRGADGAAATERALAGAEALDELPAATRGMTVYRLHGWNEEPAGGLRLVEGSTAPDGTSIPTGSGPWGHSWTTVDPRTMDDPRRVLGLPTGPDGNPGRFLSVGRLEDPTGVRVRSALPLDGNPGGGPELLIPDPERQVSLGSVEGMNPSP
jgi:hypothetical protein